MATIHEDAQLDAERIADKTSKVCKRFLAGLCPYFMLDGTKLGKDNMYKCSKHHDKRLREVYRKSVDEGGDDHGYQETLLQLIEEIVGMIDRRVARDKRVISGESKQQTIPSDVQDAIDDIEAEIQLLKQEAQRFRSSNGYFDKSNDGKQRELEQEVRNFKKDYIKIRGEQDVCMTCGVLVNAKTIEEAGHTNGKQHRAFVRLREFLPKLREYVEEQNNRGRGGGGGGRREEPARDEPKDDKNGGDWGGERGRDSERGGGRGGDSWGGGGRDSWGGGGRDSWGGSGRKRSRSPRGGRR